jgi:hypothetical protein
MMFRGCFSFCQTFSVKWPFFEKTFGQMTIFRKNHSVIWTFGQMTFRSNAIFQKKLSVTLTFGQMTFRSNDHFSKKVFSQMNFQSHVILVIWLVFQVKFSVNLINFVYGQMTFFGKINFWSNGLRLNGAELRNENGSMTQIMHSKNSKFKNLSKLQSRYFNWKYLVNNLLFLKTSNIFLKI